MDPAAELLNQHSSLAALVAALESDCPEAAMSPARAADILEAALEKVPRALDELRRQRAAAWSVDPWRGEG